MIEDGTYQGTIVKNGRDWLQFGKSAKKGTPQVLISFRIADGSDADGQTVQWTGFLTDKAMERTLESLHTCGFTGSSFRDMLAQTPSREPVEIVVQTEEYDGKQRSRVAFINRGGGYSIREEDRLSDGDLDRLSKRAQARTARDESFDSPGWADKAPASDDDIPF